MEQPDLFALEELQAPEPSPAFTGYGSMPVPMHVFNAWPASTQLKYCAARDRESAALECDDEERRAWYTERAAWYDAEATRLEAACKGQ